MPCGDNDVIMMTLMTIFMAVNDDDCDYNIYGAGDNSYSSAEMFL
jgi:hypothetical protein